MHPILFSMSGYGFRAYGIFTTAAYCAGALYLWFYRKEMGFSKEQFLDLCLSAVAGALIGGKLGGLLLYYHGPWNNPWVVFKGGLSFYQGMWGSILFAYLYCRTAGKSFPRIADYCAAALPLSHAIGRVGCLLNGCCYGKPANLPWAITFTDPLGRVPARWLGVPLHPNQIYDIAGNLVIASCLHAVLRNNIKSWKLPEGTIGWLYLLSYGVLRFWLEPLRGGDPGRIHWLMTTAQWAAVLNVGVAILLLLKSEPPTAR